MCACVPNETELEDRQVSVEAIQAALLPQYPHLLHQQPGCDQGGGLNESDLELVAVWPVTSKCAKAIELVRYVCSGGGEGQTCSI